MIRQRNRTQVSRLQEWAWRNRNDSSYFWMHLFHECL